MSTVLGYIEKIIYRNENNGYTVLSVEYDDDEYVLVGTFNYIAEGEFIKANGNMMKSCNTLTSIIKVSNLPEKSTYQRWTSCI